MCGITGIWNFDGNDIPKEKLKSFNDSLSHRGPDGDGLYIDSVSHIGLGHRRLSILDLSERGAQPMSYLNGRYQIVYNGEVFNFIELKNELLALGYTFASDTDTEVIIAAYDAWGTSALLKMNGMWAFAIWDMQKKELFIARDRFGIKPLYYNFRPGVSLAFASETIAFDSLDGFKKEFDEKLLSYAVQKPFNLEGYGYTIYKGIYSLLPGHYAVIRSEDKKIHQKRWWNTLDNKIQVPDTYEKRVKLFRDMFINSCNLRLRSDVSIGTALSGGVDSSAVYSTSII
jgi:asparagine synthase (glutamine-hydrolysing)